MNIKLLLAVCFVLPLCWAKVMATPTLTIGNGSGTVGANVTVAVTADGLSGATAWGFDLAYDSTKLTYVSLQKGAATADWATVSASLVGGKLRVGGFAGSGTALSGTGRELCKITFQIATGGASLTPSNLVDALSGATLHPGQTTTKPVPISLPEALNNTALVWKYLGYADWFGQTVVSKDGQGAAQSGPIGDDQFCWLQTTVVGPGRLTFWWKISSEKADGLMFFISDTTQIDLISGENDWQKMSYDVPAGSHNLVWVYTKDKDVSAGNDCCWIDQVNWAPQNAVDAQAWILYK